ncbi:dTDP-4-dehydrorhamnose reductase [Pelotomaculum schinkii]|uniref:dTDP-4-dehydrorhamnose reductase n=2 Tax=Pelotomaculum schinkii TaxID=78350 RepID=A0A4Y7RCN5_9FIRM|nr:dTDP-4-dehydrorhamnose reductase [Pelotomaculum schinkii]
MRVMVTGAAGMLGKAVTAEYISRGMEVIALRRDELDITEFDRVRDVIRAREPDIVVNCAAYTNVDGAESERRRAFLTNGLGPRNLAASCRALGAVLVHISTDYIFDGSKKDPYGIYDVPHPLNIYGSSKLWGERALKEIACPCYIVRTSWLFGPGGNNFVANMIKLGKAKGKASVVNDQSGSPTFTVDLARAIADLSGSGCYGTYHITNQGSTTWYDFAKEIYDMCGLAVNLSSCDSAALARPARRPAYSILDPFPLEETIGYLLPSWEKALARYLEMIKKQGVLI